jgi:hypothetical protein
VCGGSTTPNWRVEVEPISGDLVAGVRTRVVFVAKTFLGPDGLHDKERIELFFTPA